MFQQILVPLDGSKGAEHALPVAARLAHASGGRIVLAHVVSSPVAISVYGAEHALTVQPDALEKHLTEAEYYLAGAARRYANELSGVPVEQEVESGSASTTILSLARQEKNDLIVLSSHRSHSLFHWVLGGVTHEALRHSPVPLLLLNETSGTFLEPCQEHPLRILVPLDGSSLSEAALQPALHLASALATPARSVVHLLQVVDLPHIKERTSNRAYEMMDEQIAAWKEAEMYLQEVAQRLREHSSEEYGPVITWSVRINSDVAETIASIAVPPGMDESTVGYDLIAMAAHGRSGFHHLLLGSVTEHVLGATQLPLLIVRPLQTGKQHDLDLAKRVHVSRA